MQSLRALALARRSLAALRVLPNPRTLSTQPFATQDDPLRDERRQGERKGCDSKQTICS
ncbi:hypothetical protein COCNU_scaffold004226G000010 [Cocos nucifera]|nr:hypothetical protein [Cocos nucifera]